MTGAELFDLFVGGQASTKDIYEMSIMDVHRQISELRAAEPDDIDMSDEEITDAIVRYATADVLDL